MTEDEPAELDLSCGVCAQSAVLTDVTPLRFEHSVDTWARVHRHNDAEVASYRESIERINALHDEDED